MGMNEFVNVVITIIDILTGLKIILQSDANIVVVQYLYKKMKKMKNPCKDCLVVAACTQLCPAKLNYGILVEGEAQRYRTYINNSHIRFAKRTKAIYKYYEDKTNQHSRDIAKITIRCRGLL